jgi:hypothetical protein
MVSNRVNINSYNSGYVDKPVNNCILIYPVKDFAVLIKPYGLAMESRSSDDDGIRNYGNVYPYGYELELSKKLNKTFALSCLLGNIKINNDLGSGWNNNDAKKENTKPEFNISASFLPEGNSGWDFALRVGNDEKSMFRINTNKVTPNYDVLGDRFMVMPSGTYTFYYPDESDSKTLTRSSYSINTLYMYCMAGTAYKDAGDDFKLNLGVWGSPGTTQNNTLSYTDLDTGNIITEKGSYPFSKYSVGGIFNCSYRVLFKYFTVGASVDFNNLYTASPTYSFDTNLYNGRTIVGFNFTGIKSLKIPVELFYELNVRRTTDNFWENERSDNDFGGSIGLEYSFTKEFDVRLGSNYGKLIDGFENPDFWHNFYYSISGGIGFKISPLEINIGTSFNRKFTSKEIYVVSYGTNTFSLFIDITDHF